MPYTYYSSGSVQQTEYRMPILMVNDSSMDSDSVLGQKRPILQCTQVGSSALEQQLRSVAVSTNTGTGLAIRDYGTSTAIYQEVWKLPQCNNVCSVNRYITTGNGSASVSYYDWPFAFYCSSSVGVPSLVRREVRNLSIQDTVNLFTFAPALSNGWGASSQWQFVNSSSLDSSVAWAFKIDLKSWWPILKHSYSTAYRVYITLDTVGLILRNYGSLDASAGATYLCSEYKVSSSSGSLTNTSIGHYDQTLVNSGSGAIEPIDPDNATKAMFHDHVLIYTASLGATIPANTWELYVTPIWTTYVSNTRKTEKSYGLVRPCIRATVSVVYDG